MSGAVTAANAAWLASCQPAWWAFRRAVHDVEGVQRRLLLSTLRRNATSEVGKQFGFEHIETPAAYRERVPTTTAEALEPLVQRVSAGERGVLTTEQVRLLEPTGGTSGGTRLVPYTASLAREFRRGVDAWIASTYASDPQLLRGRSYWSVSPPMAGARRSSGGLPIGFDDDAAYLGVAQRALARRVLAVPAGMRRFEEASAFRLATLVALAACPDLALVSVWNPTFFSILLDELERSWGRVVEGVRALDAPRAKALDRLGPLPERVWPRLRLVSCWADANAAGPARALAARLPHARQQPKGLLATEAIVSFPVPNAEGAALALRSHYFEFDDDECVRGAHELAVGGVYSVVVTTGGGLYRYRLRDRVEVVGYLTRCPLVRFIGRDDAVSDWLGEKIEEAHAGRAVDAALRAAGLTPEFAVLSCEPAGDARRYTLFVDAGVASEADLERVAAVAESVLLENFHYAHCRRLGQLEPVEAVRTISSASVAFLDACRARGQRFGDVKPSPLYRSGDLGCALRAGSDAR